MKKYAETHEWAEINGNAATVGISTFAADELGDIVYISLPSVGQKVVAGEAMCEVESVKAVSEIMAPVSGKVIKINNDLEDAPEAINADANAAWICEIEVDSVPASLMSEEEYAGFAK